mgnify:CR=1 FL=1
MSQTLVAYFSASGVTEKCKQRILAKAAGADLYEINRKFLIQEPIELDGQEEPKYC